ncbi:MAG TPA: hypothetical protein VLA24_17470 [Pseudomonadales bacterium]|nr:hypothetical protein [Pseudomonadales bacterium]
MLAMRVETSDFDRGLRVLADTPNMIRKAVVGALSDTVDDLYTRQEMEMKRVFNKPSPYVLKGLKKSYPGGREGQSNRARFGQGVLKAGIYFEYFGGTGSPESIVKPHVFGGNRSRKSSEKRLQGMVALLGTQDTVQGRNYPRGSGGDINGARYSEMLAAVGALSETARKAMPKGKQRDRKNVSFFVIRREGTPIGIAERRGSDVKVMLVNTRKKTVYKKRYDYFGVGQKQVAYSLPLHFNRIINRMVSRL